MSPIHRLLSTLLVLLVGASSIAAQTWQQIAPVDPIGDFLTPIAMADGDVLLVDEGGRIHRSDDTGRTWTLVAAFDSLQVSACSMTPDGLLWIVCTDGTTLLSRDTARSWTRHSSPIPRPNIVHAASMSDDGTCVMNCFNDRLFYVSTNHGADWNTVDVPFAFADVPIHCVDAGLLYSLGGGTNNLLRSLDLGATWEAVVLDDSWFIVQEVTGYGNEVVIAGRGYGFTAVYHSTDGGMTFTRVFKTSGHLVFLHESRFGDLHLTLRQSTDNHFVRARGQDVFAQIATADNTADRTTTLSDGSLISIDYWFSRIARNASSGAVSTSFTRHDQDQLLGGLHGHTYVSADSVVGLLQNTRLVLSTDSGRTWSDFDRPSPPKSDGLYADRQGRLWAWGRSGVHLSKDRGLTWSQITGSRIAAAGVVQDTVVWVDTRGRACRSEAPFTLVDTVFRASTDADSSSVFDPTMHFLDDRRGAMVRVIPVSDTADQLEILTTTDAGRTWAVQTPRMPALSAIDQPDAFLLPSGEVLVGCRLRPPRRSEAKRTVSIWDPVDDTLRSLTGDLGDRFCPRDKEQYFHDAIPTQEGTFLFLVHIGCPMILEYVPSTGSMEIVYQAGGHFHGLQEFSSTPWHLPIATGRSGVVRRGLAPARPPITFMDSTISICADEVLQLRIKGELDSNRTRIRWRWNVNDWLRSPVTLIDSAFGTITITTPNSGAIQAWVIVDDIPRSISTWSIYSFTEPTVLGPRSSCQGDTLVFSTLSRPDARYLWRITNGEIVGASDRSAVQVTHADSGTSTLMLHLIDAAGLCTDSTSVSITYTPRPAITIRGPDSVDLFDRHFYHVDGYMGGTISWSSPDSTVQFLRGTDITPALIQFGEVGPRTVYLRVFGSNGCDTRDTIIVNVDSLPTSVSGELHAADPHRVTVVNGRIAILSAAPDDILYVDLVDLLGRQLRRSRQVWSSVTHLNHDDLTGPIFVAVHTRSHGIITAKVLLR